jgi:hypothetical protein
LETLLHTRAVEFSHEPTVGFAGCGQFLVEFLDAVVEVAYELFVVFQFVLQRCGGGGCS